MEKLAQAGAGDDVLLRRAHNHIGEYYADRQKWSKAVAYFAQVRPSGSMRELFCWTAGPPPSSLRIFWPAFHGVGVG